MSQNPKSISSILTYVQLPVAALGGLIIADMQVWGFSKIQAQIDQQFTSGAIWATVALNIILITNILTKFDMHKIAKLVFLGVAAGLLLLSGIGLLAGSSNYVITETPSVGFGTVTVSASNPWKEIKDRQIASGVFCLAAGVLHIITLVFIHLKK